MTSEHDAPPPFCRCGHLLVEHVIVTGRCTATIPDPECSCRGVREARSSRRLDRATAMARG